MDKIMMKANNDIKNIETYLNNVNIDNKVVYLNAFKEKYDELYTTYKKSISSKYVCFRPATKKYKHIIKPIYVYKKYEPDKLLYIKMRIIMMHVKFIMKKEN